MNNGRYTTHKHVIEHEMEVASVLSNFGGASWTIIGAVAFRGTNSVSVAPSLDVTGSHDVSSQGPERANPTQFAHSPLYRPSYVFLRDVLLTHSTLHPSHRQCVQVSHRSPSSSRSTDDSRTS